MHDTPMLYTINSCTRCQNVKNHLHALNIEFNEISLSETPRKHLDIQKYIGEVYVPLFIYGNRIIKGDRLEEINKLINERSECNDKCDNNPHPTS